MFEQSKKISHKAGLPPGTLIHIGKRKSEHVKISVIDYSASEFTEVVCQKIEEAFKYKDTDTVSWINIDGLHNTEDIAQIGQHYDLHPLLLEDILNTKHRPKAEEYDNCIFLTLKMLNVSKDGAAVVSEQLSIVLGKNWILSFQEIEGDIFKTVRQRLRDGIGNARKNGPDYLLYRLIDTVVDHYFFVTEHIGSICEKLEEEVMESPDNESLQDIQSVKKLLASFRKSVLPLREAVSILQKDETGFVKSATTRYLRDVYEHIIHVNDSMEAQRDTIASIMDLYLSGVSNKMNQVMKVLTIMATIFIPLTFIAGVYGMNFDNIPELHWKYGYFIAWGIMLILAALMIVYFRRKKWL